MTTRSINIARCSPAGTWDFRDLESCARALRMGMRYRDVDYTIVQGQGRQLWKWGFAVHSKPHTGEAATNAEAVSEAELAIDRALSLGKLRVVRQS